MDSKNIDFKDGSSGGVGVGSLDNHDIGDPLNSNSYASYKSAMSNLFNSRRHPFSSSIVSTPAETDPLLSPSAVTEAVHASSTCNSEVMNSVYSDVAISPGHASAHDGAECSANYSPDPSSSTPSSSPSSNQLNSRRSHFLRITVSIPRKEHDEVSNSIVPGGNTYVSYLITTKTNMPGFGGTEFSVRRRFRDFVTLSDRLTELYRGYFVPPRPDKNVVESQVMHKQEFVEHRRVALEKYLRRLASHPVIRKTNEFKLFLQVPGRLPLPSSPDPASRVLDGAVKLPSQLFGDSRTVMSPQEAKLPAKGGRNLLRMFKELKQLVVNDWVGSSEPPISGEDKVFSEEKEKLHAFELCLTSASKQAESLVKAEQDIGNTVGELGLAFIKLTKLENEKAMVDTQRTHASDLKLLATASIRTSRIYRALHGKTVKHLDTLHEYLELMLAARNAFSDQSSAMLTVQTLVSESSALQSKVEKLESSSPMRFDKDRLRLQKIDELKEALRVTEEAKDCSIREYEQIKENCRSELERLNREKHSDILKMLKDVVTDQVDCAERMANVWTEVADSTSDYAQESS